MGEVRPYHWGRTSLTPVQIAGIRCMPDWSLRMLLLCISGPPLAPNTSRQVCTRIQVCPPSSARFSHNLPPTQRGKSSGHGRASPPSPMPNYSRLTNQIKSSFSVLIGPINHIKHLVSKERLLFSAIYFSSLGLTLYFALGVSNILTVPHACHDVCSCPQLQSYLGSLVAGIVQVSCAPDPSIRTLIPDSGRRSGGLRTRILSRRYTNASLWRTNCPARCRQPSSLLILSSDTHCLRPIHGVPLLSPT